MHRVWHHPALPPEFKNAPVTSDLTCEEMWNLASLGYAPLKLVLGTAVYFASGESHAKAQAAGLQKQVAEQPLLAATTTRPLLLQPNRTAPSKRPQASINGSSGEFADFKIDVSWSTYTNFRVLIDRVGQGRFAVIGNLLRDSNGQLRFGFLKRNAIGHFIHAEKNIAALHILIVFYQHFSDAPCYVDAD